MYFYMKLKKNSVWYNFYQGTSVSITFYIFEHYQLCMMDSKAQRVFFPKTPKLCVWLSRIQAMNFWSLSTRGHSHITGLSHSYRSPF